MVVSSSNHARLAATMPPWETDPSLRDTGLVAEVADAWSALPKVVFSRTLDSVRGNARLAGSSVPEAVAMALGATDKDIKIPVAPAEASDLSIRQITAPRTHPSTGAGPKMPVPIVVSSAPIRPSASSARSSCTRRRCAMAPGGDRHVRGNCCHPFD